MLSINSVPVCFSTKHHINDRVVRAFAKGCDGQIIYEPKGKFITSYGLKRGCIEAYRQSESFIYIDKGYYFPSNHPHDFSGYYRVVNNGLIHSGKGNYPWDRFEAFGYQLKPWNKNGRHIIFCPILSVPAQFYGVSLDEWTLEVYNKIRKHSGRSIIVSSKDNGVNAKKYFKDAHCLVTHSSNIGIEALIEGVPVIYLSPDRPIGSIEEIEHPMYDRQILANLAYQQWTLKEMESGRCWKELNEF